MKHWTHCGEIRLSLQESFGHVATITFIICTFSRLSKSSVVFHTVGCTFMSKCSPSDLMFLMTVVSLSKIWSLRLLGIKRLISAIWNYTNIVFHWLGSKETLPAFFGVVLVYALSALWGYQIFLFHLELHSAIFL